MQIIKWWQLIGSFRLNTFLSIDPINNIFPSQFSVNYWIKTYNMCFMMMYDRFYHNLEQLELFFFFLSTKWMFLSRFPHWPKHFFLRLWVERRDLPADVWWGGKNPTRRTPSRDATGWSSWSCPASSRSSRGRPARLQTTPGQRSQGQDSKQIREKQQLWPGNTVLKHLATERRFKWTEMFRFIYCCVLAWRKKYLFSILNFCKLWYQSV